MAVPSHTEEIGTHPRFRNRLNLYSSNSAGTITMISRVDTSPHGVSTRPHWLIGDWLVGFDPIRSQLFRPTRVFSHTSGHGKHLQRKRNSTSCLHGKSHNKAILSLCQVGVPSKHAKNEGEKHLNSSNSTKRNKNGRIGSNWIELDRFGPRIQGPPVISTIPNKDGVFKAKRHKKWS